MKKQLSLTLLSTLCALGVLSASPNLSSAQPAAEADAHNDAGKALFKERRYLEAYRRFKQAAELSAEGRFYFNICFSLNYLERFEEAVAACEQVEPNGADPALMKKTNTVLTALRAKLPAPADPPPAGPTTAPNAPDPTNPNPAGTTTDPNATTPNATETPPNANPGDTRWPVPDPFATKEPTGDYAWSLGLTLNPLANLGVGTDSDGDAVYSAGVGLNVFANFMYGAEQQIGIQVYGGAGSLPPADDAVPDPLTIYDLGGAIYKHYPLAKNIDFSPLVGLHAGFMQPDSSSKEVLLVVGLKLQASVDYYLGAGREHVLSFAPAIKAYSPAFSESEMDAKDDGLDTGGAILEFGFGYTYRFTSPFGSGPLFTLE
ncbi:MAG: hypothetical protein GY811_05000 [Myxococcales bacterium]|nr:hypothetical protein [Myxococcales bacterium]